MLPRSIAPHNLTRSGKRTATKTVLNGAKRTPMRLRFSMPHLRGGARLVADAVVGVTDLTEAVHATISPFSSGRPNRARGIAKWVYRCIRGLTRRTERALDRALAAVEQASAPTSGGDLPPGATPAPSRETTLAVLNGVLGDWLVSQGNPLATPMQLRHAGRPLLLDPASVARTVPAPSATLLVQVHGLCMHDGQWGNETHDQGAVLAEGLDATPVALRYNSGRHIYENGRDFAAALDALVAAWPLPVARLVIVGHSMGGLVARSAFDYAAEAGYAWLALDAALVTLGSPHHGAPLERIGHGIDVLLGATRYSAPFARLGRVRSAGVTDLRHGRLLSSDRAGSQHTPGLPEGVACYLVAATTGSGHDHLRNQTIGDGLVPLDSALGRHPDPALALSVPAERQWIAVGMNHFDLLRCPEVTAQLLAWLAPPLRRSR